MKALPFTIPAADGKSYLLQYDKIDHFYPYLHRHKEIQICQIIKGQGSLLVQGEIYPFSPGDIFIISSNSAHLFKNESPGIETLSLFFSPNPSESQLMSLPEMKHISKHYQTILSCQKISEHLLESTAKMLTRLHKNNNESGFLIFLEIIHHLKSELRISEENKMRYSEEDGDRMQTILKFTLENYSRDINIRDIANEISYTPEAFCRFFKRRTRKTYIQYLNDLRISEACQLIINSPDKSISEVAFLSGYNNVSHFNRTFKKIKGVSPLNFRSENVIF